MDEYDNNFNGCLIGFAIGDALGSPLEFSERDILNQVIEMETNYLYDLPPGCWTEKTSEMLCTAISIMEKDNFIYEDFLLKYYQLVVNGYLLPHNKHIEINNYIKSTGYKIGQFLKYRKKLPLIINPNDHHQQDCEPILRIAPIILKYHNQPKLCIKHIEIITNLTHISKSCVDVCKFYTGLMIGALMGVNKHTLLSEQFNVMDITTYGDLKYDRLNQTFLENCTDTIINIDNQKIKCRSTKENKFLRTLFPSVINIQKGSYKCKNRDLIRSDNNILYCVEAALWSFYTTDTFDEGCIKAVNLGLNSCSIGAIYGQLAGLYYGLSNIPQIWISKLYQCDYIKEISGKLH